MEEKEEDVAERPKCRQEEKPEKQEKLEDILMVKPKSRQAAKPPKSDLYGLNMQQLTKWQSDRNSKANAKEKSLQAKAVARVVGFLNAINVAVQLQSWYRMIRVRKQYYVILAQRRDIKYMFYRAWKIHHYSEKMFRYCTVGQFFVAWKDELTDSKRLKKLIYEFFKICIKRSRLTPQACMCYFNPGEWSKTVSVDDMMKIRRMMMEKLFTGWRAETRELRIMRSKATQVLSRMVRRTKGPLWVKEASLVCFHMWYRYVKVKRAYRLEEPDPRFTNPYLPQWTKLFKEITLARVKRKRSMATGHKLTQMRAFRTWKYLKSIDRSKPVTALAVAIIHYGKVLARKCIIAWHEVVRERGKIMRFRNVIFYRWKKWAPQNRKLWAFNDKALAWLRLKQMRRAYGVMVDLCLDVISKRTERMKELRRNFYDRKVVICAYALMGKNEHVIYIDCWRRLYHYWQCRKNWKLYNMQRKFQWHYSKAKAIFNAWKTYTTARAELKKSNIPQMRELFNHPNHSTGSRFPSMLAGQGLSPSMMSSIGSTIGQSFSRPMTATIGEDSNDDQSVESLGDNNSIDSTGNTHPAHGVHATPRTSIAGGQLRASRAMANQTRRKRHAAPEPDYQMLIESYVPVGYELMEAAMAGNISKNMTEWQFQLFCLAILQSRANAKQISENEKREAEKPRRASFANSNMPAAPVDPASSTQPTPGTTAAPTPIGGTPRDNAATGGAPPPDAAANVLKNLKTDSSQSAPTEDADSTRAALYNVSLQEKLQRSIDEMHMDDILSAVAEGAVIESQHIRQVGMHIGDHYIPAFTVLMSCGVAFLAERAVKKDTIGVLNAIQNPVNAFLLGSQIERWHRRDLTKRELASLMDSSVCHKIDSFGGAASSVQLWHNVVLKLIDVRAKTIALTCQLLTEERTVSQEVSETLKRNKIERLNHIRKTIVHIFGLNDEAHQITKVPALVVPHAVLKASRSFMAKKAPQLDANGEERDIYVVLREFTLMTGKLTNEGKAMRGPLLERDRALIVNGFVKQSKLDLAVLRRQCMTPAQLAAENERLAKEAAKNKKGTKDKGGKKKKKKKRASSAKKKKNKKSKKKGSKSGTDTEDTDDDTYSMASTSGDEMSVGTGSIDVRFNDYYMDGEFLRTEDAMTEESDILREKEYQKRLSHYRNAIYQEVWQPLHCHVSEEITDQLITRFTYEMKATIHRIMHVIQKDEHIGNIDISAIKAKYGGIGQYLLDRGTGDQKIRGSRTWHVLPKEWWSFKQVKSRLAKELAIVEGVMAQHKAKIAKQNDINDGLDEEISFYEKYLKSVRKEVLKISQKRNEKSNSDSAEKMIKVGALKRAERQLATTNKQVATLTDKLRLSEIYLASGNVKGVLGLLKPPEPEPTEEEKAKIKKEKEKAAKKKAAAAKSGKPVEDDEDSDGSEDSYSLYGLIEQAKEELVKLKESVIVIEAKRLKIDLDIRDYERQCYRTTKLLKNIAEDRFNTMVEVQSMVIRTTKNLENSENSKSACSKARKLTMKYFMQLRAFSDVNMQQRGIQLAKDVENKRLTELLRKPGGTILSKSDNMSVGSGGSRGGGASRRSFSGVEDKHHHDRPDSVTRHSVDISTIGQNYEHMESLVLPDITVTEEEMEQYNQHHHGRASPTESMYSYDEDNNSRADENSRSESVSREGGHIDPNEYRPLTVDEEIMLLHQNSIGNRKKREEELKRIALQQAEEAAANELRTKVFDDYWSSYPKKEIYIPSAAVQAAEIAKKKQKEKEEAAEKEAALLAATTKKPMTKTEKMWKSVGTAYWRNKEDQIREIFEAVLAKELAEADEFGEEDMEVVMQKQKIAQIELNKRKNDPFEECVVVDVRKDWDKEGPDPQFGLMHKISTDFAELSDVVWQSTIVPPPPAGALAALAQYVERPPLSTSVKDLLKHKRQAMTNAGMGEIFDMAENVHDYAAEEAASRRPSVMGEGSRRPSLKDASHEIIQNMRRSSFTGVVDAAVHHNNVVNNAGHRKKKVDAEDEEELDVKVVDPFAVIGKLEYMRFKVGMQAKSEMMHKDEDMSYSVESRTGVSVGSNPSRRKSNASEMEKRFSPNKDMTDDLSDVSEGEKSLGSHTSSQHHQQQVNEYLNMIDEPVDDKGRVSPTGSKGSKGEKPKRHLSKKETDFLLTEAALAGGMDIITNIVVTPPPVKVETVSDVIVSPLATPVVVSASPVRQLLSPDAQRTRAESAASDGPTGILTDKAAKPSNDIKAPKLVRFGEDDPNVVPVAVTVEAPTAPIPESLSPKAAIVPTVVEASVEPEVAEPVKKTSEIVDQPAKDIVTPLDALIQPQQKIARSLLQDDETSEISMDENLQKLSMLPGNIDLQSHENSLSSPPPPRSLSRVQFSDSGPDVLTSIHVSVTKGGSTTLSGPAGATPPIGSPKVHAPKVTPFSPGAKHKGVKTIVEGETAPAHLERVLVAANAARSSIKVKKGGPIHNAHEKFLPENYPDEVSESKAENLVLDVEMMKQPSAYLEMPAVYSPENNNTATNLGYKKKKLIHGDRPSSVRSLRSVQSFNQNVGSPSEDLIAVPKGSHWDLEVPPPVDNVAVNKELHYSLNYPPGLTVAGTQVYKIDLEDEDQSVMKLDGLADHDLPDGTRLIGLLGLSPTHHPGVPDDLEDEEVHLVNDPKSIPAELNYESLLSLVDEFKTELKLLHDKENAVVEDKVHKSISFFPSYFRSEVMKNAPLIPRKRKNSVDDRSVHAPAPTPAPSSAVQSTAVTPQTPTKRNRNLTKSTPPATAAAPTPAPVVSPEPRRESKALLNFRPPSHEEIPEPTKTTLEDLENALHKYLTETYHLNPKDIVSGHVEEEGVESAVRGIKQYFADQERSKRESHSSGHIRPLESRDMAARYRNALRMADTLAGQGGMFFKPQSPVSPSGRFRHQVTSSNTSALSDENLRRAGSASFWVEVIKLLHPDNETIDDTISDVTLDRRLLTSENKKTLPQNDGAPALSLDVVKLNHLDRDPLNATGDSRKTRSALESFRSSNPPQATVDIPAYVRVEPTSAGGERKMITSQSDSLLLQSKPHRVPKVPYNDRFKPEVLDFVSSQPVLAGKKVEKSASMQYLGPNSETYYRTGSGSGIAEKLAASLHESINSYVATHPENQAYKMDTGLKSLQEMFGFAPDHELIGVSVPNSPNNSRPVSPEIHLRKSAKSSPEHKSKSKSSSKHSEVLTLNTSLFAEHSLGSAQIVSEIAGEHYHMSGNNSVVNTERNNNSALGINPMHNTSFPSPLLDTNQFPLLPPSPENISIYSKQTLRSADGRMRAVAGDFPGVVLDSRYIQGENSLLVDSHVLRGSTGSPPRSPHAKFSISTSSPPMSAGRPRSYRDRTIVSPGSSEPSRELSGVIKVVALNRGNSQRSAKRPKVSVDVENDTDDDSTIHSVRSQTKSNYIGNMESRSLTLDDYMRLKQQEGKYLYREEDEVGGGGVVAHFKRKMREPSPVKLDKALSFLEQPATENDTLQLELSSVEAMKKAFAEQEALEERLRQEKLQQESMQTAPSLKIVSRVPSNSVLEEPKPVPVVDDPNGPLKVVGISKSPKKSDSNILILDDESTIPDGHRAHIEPDDEEEMERELRSMLNENNSVAYQNAKLYAAMYLGQTARPALSANVPFLAGHGGESKHLSTKMKDREVDRKSRHMKSALLPPLQTPPTSAGKAEAATVYRGLSDTLQQQKLLKPIHHKKTVNPMYMELAQHLPSKHYGTNLGPGLNQPVNQMSVTAPTLSANVGRNRAGSVTSLGSNSSSKYSKELIPMAMSVEFKPKKKAL